MWRDSPRSVPLLHIIDCVPSRERVRPVRSCLGDPRASGADGQRPGVLWRCSEQVELQLGSLNLCVLHPLRQGWSQILRPVSLSRWSCARQARPSFGTCSAAGSSRTGTCRC